MWKNINWNLEMQIRIIFLTRSNKRCIYTINLIFENTHSETGKSVNIVDWTYCWMDPEIF